MILLVDESVDQSIVERLRQDGLTADKDFGELVFRQNRIHGGIVLLRIFGVLAEIKAEIVADTLRVNAAELAGGFTVISPGTVRIRRS